MLILFQRRDVAETNEANKTERNATSNRVKCDVLHEFLLLRDQTRILIFSQLSFILTENLRRAHILE